MILNGPFSVITLSVNEKLATPDELDWIFPRSPTCLFVSLGAPCVLLNGLKCAPADRHPEVASPSWLVIAIALMAKHYNVAVIKHTVYGSRGLRLCPCS